MAWRLFDRKHHEPEEWTGFLEQGVKFGGRLEVPGTFRVDSDVHGTIVSRDTLILGEHASVQGQIHGNRVVIGGRFEGKIEANSTVVIQTKAIVTGEIRTPCLVIEPGAVFDGQCHMPIFVPAATRSESPNTALAPLTIPIRSAIAQPASK
jgi:cytoskeletal protein CcmA (bactofilin family)